MKKFILALFMLGLGFAFIACNSTTTEENVDFVSNDQVFTVEALSAANLLDYSNISTLSYVPLMDSVTTDETTTEAVTAEDTQEGSDDLIVDEIDVIDQYLGMMDTFLGDNNALATQILVSDKAEWDNLISFTTVNILGEEEVYYMYYNETLYESDLATTEEPATTTEEPSTEAPETTEAETTTALAQGDQEFVFADEDDDNVLYSLTGLIVYGDIEYNVEGKRVVESNGDEILRLRSFIDKDNYVTVTYKTDAEDGLTKFFFRVVTDGVLVNSSSVRVVQDGDDLKVFLRIADDTQVANYQFMILLDGDTTMYHIKYDIKEGKETVEEGNIHIVATTDPETGETVYTYKVLGSDKKVRNEWVYRYEIETRHENHSQKDAEHGQGKGNV